MMKGSIKVARIAGIDIGIHYSWILIFVLVVWSLAVGYFPVSNPGWETWLYWVTSIVAGLLLFASVLFHELAHSLVAKAQGTPVKSITLFLLGGVSNLESEPEKASVEFAVSLAGPLSSVLLAGIFWAAVHFEIVTSGAGKAILQYLALINILLAAFNILPGFPLDGGRVLRSIIWGMTNNLKKATDIATTVGQVFGWIMISIGVFWALTGDLISGIWLGLIGWFLNSSAESSRRELEMRSLWLNVKVANVMNDRPETISPATSIETLVNDIYVRRGLRVAPVIDNDKLVGLVTLADIKKVPMDQWRNTPVNRVMTPQPLKAVKADDSMSVAIQLMAEHSLDQLPVMAGERLVGLLRRADIIRYVQIHHELGKR